MPTSALYDHTIEAVSASSTSALYDHTVEAIPTSSTSALYDHEAEAAPETSTSALYDHDVEEIGASTSALYDHDIAEFPPLITPLDPNAVVPAEQKITGLLNLPQCVGTGGSLSPGVCGSEPGGSDIQKVL